VLTLAAVSIHASAQHPNFSGTYTLLPDKSVAASSPSSKWSPPRDLTAGRTVVGSCGTQFVITQTATQFTIRVVSGVTAAHRYYLPPVDGTYALNRGTTVSSIPGYSKKVTSVSWRGAALDLVLTQYNSETPAGRVEYIFRHDKDNTLSVASFAGSGTFSTVTSVYQKSTS
jgi:hypothetical protein